MFTLVSEKLDEYSLDASTPLCFRLQESDLLIEVAQVIFGYRVTLREIGSGILMADWCAGPSYDDILFLLECMAGYVLSDNDPPFNSHIKPYFKDASFVGEATKFHSKGAVPFTPALYQVLRLVAPIIKSDEQESVLG